MATLLDADPASFWDDYRPTPLLSLPALARRAGVGRVLVKAEHARPLGNFKALGGMVAGLRALARATGADTLEALVARRGRLPGLVCASDGNHGLAVAAAAQRAGTPATVYLPQGVSAIRARRIEALGGRIARVAGSYDDAVDAAAQAAARDGNLLVADTSPDPRDDGVHDVMAGYAVLVREIVAQLDVDTTRPSHLFVQAGVGGLAAAMADGLRARMRYPARIVVVEPATAACVAHALELGQPERIAGDLRTVAGMLACGLASAPALAILLRHEARAVRVREHGLRAAVHALQVAGGPASTPSGTAGLAGLLRVAGDARLRAEHGLDPDSDVLLVASEGKPG